LDFIGEKQTVVECGDGDVTWIVGGVGTRLEWEKAEGVGLDADVDGTGGSNAGGGLFADLGGGVGGREYVPREGNMRVVRVGGGSLGIARVCVLVSELCEPVFVWLDDPVEDFVAPKSSTNLLPLFLSSRLVKEYISGFSSDVSCGVGYRRRLVR
jgi:hypothetical protein